MSNVKSYDLIGNRTRDLLACSIGLQRTTVPLAPHSSQYFSILISGINIWYTDPVFTKLPGRADGWPVHVSAPIPLPMGPLRNSSTDMHLCHSRNLARWEPRLNRTLNLSRRIPSGETERDGAYPWLVWGNAHLVEPAVSHWLRPRSYDDVAMSAQVCNHLVGRVGRVTRDYWLT
jgi:hypothetical protein